MRRDVSSCKLDKGTTIVNTDHSSPGVGNVTTNTQSPRAAAKSGHEDGRAPQRRDPRRHRAILEATVELVAETGYSGLTIEGVAARAGVGKATIYRWWPSKGALVLEALSELLELGPVPDTGTTRGDLIALVRDLVEVLTRPGATAVVASLAADASRDPELGESLRTRLVRPRRACNLEIIERAVDRGDLPASVDRELFLDLLGGPVFFRLLISGRSLEPDFAETLVDFLLATASGASKARALKR